MKAGVYLLHIGINISWLTGRSVAKKIFVMRATWGPKQGFGPKKNMKEQDKNEKMMETRLRANYLSQKISFEGESDPFHFVSRSGCSCCGVFWWCCWFFVRLWCCCFLVIFFAPSFNQILVANFRDAPPCFSRARPWKTKNKFSEIVFQQVRAIIGLRMFRRVWWHSLLQLLCNYAVAIIMQTLVDLDDFHLRSLRDLKQLPVLHSTPAIFELVYEVEVA